MAKRIEYDPHAVLRMRQRGYSPEDVVHILTFGWPADPGLARWVEDRHAKQEAVRGVPTKVVYLENDERYYVITIEQVWQRGP